MASERRATFRVSVKPGSGLVASLRVSDRYWRAVPGNISAEGIFIRLEPAARADLKVGSTVDVEITFAGETLLLRGVIRSRRGGGYGIFFPEADDEDHNNPLDKLARISAHLQREVLSKRLFRGSE